MQYRSRRSYLPGRRQARGLALAALFGAAALGGISRAHDRFQPAGPRLAAVAEKAAGTVAPPGVHDRSEWDLPNLDHPRVDHFVRVFTTGKRDEFARYLSRSGRYAPMISRKLAERGMPQDLLYLAMIESGFNPTAYSHAHASGLWQFIAGTGRLYGLDINRAVDERRDPEKATDAALDYLQDLHRQFGSWYLAAAAYNTGGGRVSRVMRQETGSEKGDEESYYRIRHRLPRETRDYVPLMVAAARVAKERHRYGFGDVKIEEPLVYDSVVVEPATPLAEVAATAGTTVDEIRRLNPQLKLERTRNDVRSTVRVPKGSRILSGGRG